MNGINSVIIQAKLYGKTLSPVVLNSTNYVSGKRNNQRVLWSNDGLVFVTYNHYETFIEIV